MAPEYAAAPGMTTEGRRENDLTGEQLQDTATDVTIAVETELASSLLNATDRTTDKALESVADADILDGVARAVVRTIRKLRSENRSIAPVLVAARLEQDQGALPDVLRRTPLVTLAMLSAQYLLPTLAPDLALTVAERARRRDLATAGGRLLRLANIAEPDQLRAIAASVAAIVDRLEAGVTI